MDKHKLIQIRDQMQTVLNEFADEIGVSITIGGAAYTQDYADFKVQVAELNKDGSPRDEMSRNVDVYGHRYGITKAHIGKAFRYNGRLFTFVGIMPRRSKYPFVATDVQQGKKYKLPVNAAEFIKQA